MKIVYGNLLTMALAGQFDVIIHGCNCFCQMGAGIAKDIKALFPEAFEADRLTMKGSEAKLGSTSSATIVRGDVTFEVVNGYTQYHWGGEGVKADYDAIRKVMANVKTLNSGQRIGYPMIGAGLAEGDWSIISAIIDEELAGEDHTFVVYEP